MSNTEQGVVEITLPPDSLIRTLVEGRPVNPDVTDDPNIKPVDKTLSDEEYNELLTKFLEHCRTQNEINKPSNKLKRKLESFKTARQKAEFRGLKPGFLEKKKTESKSSE